MRRGSASWEVLLNGQSYIQPNFDFVFWMEDVGFLLERFGQKNELAKTIENFVPMFVLKALTVRYEIMTMVSFLSHK